MENGVLGLLWCSYPSMELALAEGAMGSAVSAPAVWEFELILDSGLIQLTNCFLGSLAISHFYYLDLRAQEKLLLFPVCISDLMFWVCFVLFFSNHVEAAWEVRNCITDKKKKKK